MQLSHPSGGDTSTNRGRQPVAVNGTHPHQRSCDAVGVQPNPPHRATAATVLIDAGHLRAEMDARGVTGRDLARETGISEGTIYNALGQRPILVRNAKLIAGALQRLEVDPGLARLVLERVVPAVALPASRGGQAGGVEVDVALHHAHR
jgi:lambda repressor-like predicted transcriptional regulator